MVEGQFFFFGEGQGRILERGVKSWVQERVQEPRGSGAGKKQDRGQPSVQVEICASERSGAEGQQTQNFEETRVGAAVSKKTLFLNNLQSKNNRVVFFFICYT